MATTSVQQYIIHGGQEGSDRLKVLARATWPTSKTLLQEAGLREGMRCPDVGCGNGEITFRLLESLGPSGEVVGLDFDEQVIQIAREAAQERGAKAQFRVFNIEKDPFTEKSAYDFVHTRFLLSHLRDAEQATPKLLEALRPGGILAAEDVDFMKAKANSWHCSPCRTSGTPPLTPNWLPMRRSIG